MSDSLTMLLLDSRTCRPTRATQQLCMSVCIRIRQIHHNALFSIQQRNRKQQQTKNFLLVSSFYLYFLAHYRTFTQQYQHHNLNSIMSVARYIIAGLAGAASISAFPQSSYAPQGPSSMVTAYGSASVWPGKPTGTPPVVGVPSVVAPSAAPVDSAAAAAARASAAALAKKVNADVTNVDRFNELLTVDGAGKQILDPATLQDRTVFDFNKKLVPQGDGGLFVLANENNFPILVDQGISTAVAVLNPCSMNSPHTHPRATEWLTVVDGQVQTGFMLENNFLPNAKTGALTTQISSNLTAFQATIFPMGSIHFQFNPTCEPATFIATLNHADPGTSQVAQNFFFLDDNIVNITLGEINNINAQNIDQFRNTLPPNLVQAVDSCLSKCGH